jgi:cytoskeletal protein CcmA (bactofilin family)
MVNPDSVREQVVPDARQNPDERRMAAWIGKSLLVQGKIVSTEDLTIHGGVEGTIELGDHSLTIGDGAAIKADLVAKIIHISGNVTGNVMATIKVEVKSTASVTGDITAPLLIVADGAVIVGTVDASGKGKADKPPTP